MPERRTRSGRREARGARISARPSTGKGENLYIAEVADNITVKNSWFQDGFNAVFWGGTAQLGTMTNNLFDPSIRVTDIICGGADSALSGTLNQNAVGAAPTCSGCQGCPFGP